MTTSMDRRLFVISGLLARDLLLTRLSLAADVECPVRVGEYSGTVKAEWLTKTREMRLLEDFAFKGPDCRVWAVPKGAVVNGASIPRVFWSLIGGPFEGRYRDASVVHDYYCKIRTAPSAEVHEMFYHAMLANGVETHIAGTMYYAVYWFGPSWHILKGVSKTATGPAVFETVRVTDSRELDIPQDILRKITITAGQPAPIDAGVKLLRGFGARYYPYTVPTEKWLRVNGSLVDRPAEPPFPEAFLKAAQAGYSQSYIGIKTSAPIFQFYSTGPLVPNASEADAARVLAWVQQAKPSLAALRTTSPSSLPR